MARPGLHFSNEQQQRILEAIRRLDVAFPHDNAVFLDEVIEAVHAVTRRVYGVRRYTQWLAEAGVGRRPSNTTLQKAVDRARGRGDVPTSVSPDIVEPWPIPWTLAETGTPAAQTARSFAPSSPQASTHTLPDNSTQVLARPAGESASQSQVRQFAQPSMAPGKPRLSMPSGEFSFGWSLNQGGSGPGIAWDPGLKRKGRPNEDSGLSMRGTCNFAERLQPFELHIVADGMGGHAQGRLASHLAIRGMLETVIPGLVACQEIDSEQVIVLIC